MSAQIINFAEARARRSGGYEAENSVALLIDEAIDQASEAPKTPQFHFWTGASGQRYIHTIHSLLSCPELPQCNYILVRATSKNESGYDILAIGQVDHPTPSLNLAELRQRGAELGATGVHVHLLATSPEHSQQIARDLKTAWFKADPKLSV